MLNANNPAVNLATRSFLWGLNSDERGLDDDDIRQLITAVERVKAVSPSGWVFLLSRALGASHVDAMEAGSFAELYYAMCSFTDDVQDGDAAEYMEEQDPRLLINTLAQLICVTVVRGERFISQIGDGPAGTLTISSAFLDGAVMLRGQRLELLRESWSTLFYQKVADLSAGRQFDVYFKAAALAAGVSAEPLLHLSNPIGLLVQVAQDRLSNDERLLQLPEDEMTAVINAAKEELRGAAARVQAEARPVIHGMMEYALSL